MADDFLSHTPKKKSLDAASAMGGHGDDPNIFPVGMGQNFFGMIPVSHMGIDLKSLRLQPLFDPLKVCLGLADDSHLRLRGIHSWKGMGKRHPQKANTNLQVCGQAFNLWENVLCALGTIERNQNPFFHLHRESILSTGYEKEYTSRVPIKSTENGSDN